MICRCMCMKMPSSFISVQLSVWKLHRCRENSYYASHYNCSGLLLEYRIPDNHNITSAYLDDILVNEDIVKASRVEEHLARYGLLCKPPERVGDGTRVLGLRVWGERDRLVWRRDTKVGDVPQRLSRRSVFSYCGRLTGHFPVCGWLRVAAAFLKRAVTAATSSWDEAVESSWLKTFLGEIAARMSKEDPVRGTWNVSGERARLWVDASALAIGAALEVDGSIVEDAAWLRPNDACHINMAEVDAAIKGLNLALSWNMKTVELMTDSSTVFRWISNGLSGRTRLKTKAANEMLIRRRIGTGPLTGERVRLETHRQARQVGGQQGRCSDMCSSPMVGDRLCG
ncbi:hypothetical protein M514_14792 [Trichuris suis]|uniref:Uncharacterized protein n=1 Tax=Trichuris suis TaxID=68888 RepID=A0A085NTU2_9BILA|nr:hypothetical protein M514_14792 [Trichuris suis]